MSEPVSNAEIEDVLSSIRRLVSEEPSPLLRRRKIAEGAKERFVLTPALRVSQEDAADAHTSLAPQAAEAAADKQAPDTEAPKPAVDMERFSVHRQTLEQRIAELEAALQQSTEEWEPDGSEVSAERASGMPSFDAPLDAEDDQETALNDPQQEVADSEPGTELDAAETDSSQPTDDPEVAELVDVEFAESLADALGDDIDEVEVEDIADKIADEVAQVEDVDSEDETAFTEVDADDDSEDDADDGAEVDTEDETARYLDAELSVPEDQSEDTAQSHVSDISETSSADAKRDDEPLQWAGPQDDAAETDVFNISDQPDDRAEADFDMFGDDEVLDESALREMVSQLVREELQGVLGERITRNVRRLVRREIQRAMSVREME